MSRRYPFVFVRSLLLRLLAVVALIVVIVGCDLDRSGLWRPTSSAEPALICPGDTVTVSWYAGPTGGCEETGSGMRVGSGCGDPTAVEVTSDPAGLFASNPVPTDETEGSRTVAPSDDTTISLRFSDRDEDLGTQTHRIDVLTEDLRVDGTFVGACCGNVPCWQPLAAQPGGSVSDSVVLTEVCNNNTFSISIQVATAGGPMDFTLEPLACTGELRGAGGVTVIGVGDPTITAGATCSPTIQNPPRSFGAQSVFRCRRG